MFLNNINNGFSKTPVMLNRKHEMFLNRNGVSEEK